MSDNERTSSVAERIDRALFDSFPGGCPVFSYVTADRVRFVSFVVSIVTMNTMSNRYLDAMLVAILETRPHEIDCEECFRKIDSQVDELTIGRGAMLPAVRVHLTVCRDCRLEFEALLAVMRYFGG